MSLSTKQLKTSLILLTIVSVICDSMILPFYPQFFSQAFGVDDPRHTGYYIASCCITVMVMFPLWAKLACTFNELHIWVYTQVAAATLGVACFYTNDLTTFWVLSQLMLVFKASYLLIYPFVMRLEEKDGHLNMVGLFSVLMHFGAIGGALLGGATLNYFNPKNLYIIMAMGDIFQVLVCCFLIVKLDISLYSKKPKVNDESSLKSNVILPFYLVKLCIVSLLFYFAAFSLRPFLSRYWESISNYDSPLISGLVYSIPGWVALIGLWLNFRLSSRLTLAQRIALAIFWTLFASFLQSSSNEWVLIFGRFIYGWGLFQAMVCLEVSLFKVSQPENYARDFSRIHFFQNLGVIFASFTSGYLVAVKDLQSPFFVGAGLFLLTLLIFIWLYRSDLFSSRISQVVTQVN